MSAEGFGSGTRGPWRPGHRPRQQRRGAGRAGQRGPGLPPRTELGVPKSSGKRGMDSALKWMLALNHRQTQQQRHPVRRALNPQTAVTPVPLPSRTAPLPFATQIPRAEAPQLPGR